jgi:hypothetical protein
MPDRLRIAVTGLAATYPFGGVFWDYLQYPLGLHRLGHDVLYVEDTGKWMYDPIAQTFVPDGQNNARLLAERIAQLDPALSERWFFRDAHGRTFGKPAAQAAEFCRSADLFIHISASCWMRDEYFAARRTVFIDSDPMYTQAAVPPYLDGTVSETSRAQLEMIRRHDVHFTFAENIGSPDCRVPTELFHWIPTRQPIVLDCFDGHQVPVEQRRPILTTVASWEPTEKGPTVRGVRYEGKSVEFNRFIDLPARSKLPLEIAISGQVPRAALAAAGWRIREGVEVSADPWAYRRYLAESLAEWSVAKNAYVASRSGWFSCRTACYLALGVPAIVQDTGFTPSIPAGQGVLAFTTIDQAAAAIDELARHPARHAAAAHAIAREYFDARSVLGRLVDQATATATAIASSPATRAAVVGDGDGDIGAAGGRAP